MPKKNLSSLELAALVNEFQSLINSRISQIYHHQEEFFFQLHTKTGKQLLRIIPGKLINLTPAKDTQLKPSSFCLQLRKHLNHAFIRSIRQKDTERILIIQAEKEQKYILIIELFLPGNLILTDQDYQTIATFHQKKFKDRFIRPRTIYRFPSPTTNWQTLTEKQLQSMIKKTSKTSLAAFLATEIGLGGLYAEELCRLANLNKAQPPQELAPEAPSSIIKIIKQFIKNIEKPQGFLYPEQITPFPLQNQKEISKTSSYSRALDTLQPAARPSPYQKGISALKKIINQQEEAARRLEQEIKTSQEKAETIYHHYSPLNKFLQIISKLKQTRTWEEIKEELKKEKNIKSIDLKNKKVTIRF